MSASPALLWGLSSAGGDSVQRAHIEAMRMLAAKQKLSANAAGLWVFTAESCGGVYPDDKNTPPELRWWNANTNECVVASQIGLDFCEKTGSLDFEPDAETGIAVCKVTPGYCNAKGMNYIDGDCETNFTTYLMEQLVGATLARGFQYVSENPEEVLEAAVAGAAAAVDQAGQPFAPTTAAIDSVARKMGISPYTSAAKEAAIKYTGKAWQRTGAVALRGIGTGIRKWHELQAKGFKHTADGIRYATSAVESCAEDDCLKVGEGITIAAEGIDRGRREVVSGIRQVPGGDMAIYGINAGAEALGLPDAAKWVAGPGGAALKDFGSGMLQGFKQDIEWGQEGVGYATDYTTQGINAMADMLKFGHSEAVAGFTEGQRMFFDNVVPHIAPAVTDAANAAKDGGEMVGGAIAGTAKDTWSSVSSAFGGW